VYTCDKLQSINQSVIIQSGLSNQIHHRVHWGAIARKIVVVKTIFKWRLKYCNVGAETMCSGRELQIWAAATGKARLPTVESLTGGTTSWLVPAEGIPRRPETLAVEVNGPRYRNKCNRCSIYGFAYARRWQSDCDLQLARRSLRLPHMSCWVQNKLEFGLSLLTRLKIRWDAIQCPTLWFYTSMSSPSVLTLSFKPPVCWEKVACLGLVNMPSSYSASDRPTVLRSMSNSITSAHPRCIWL